MSFLRRLLGGDRSADAPESAAEAAERASDEEIDAAEREYQRDLLRAEAERLDDLRQRQLRYADRAWKPPSQGRDRRSEDADAGEHDG